MTLEQLDSEVRPNLFRSETTSLAPDSVNCTSKASQRLRDQIAAAQTAVAECSDALSATRASQMHALAALYAVALAFDQQPEAKAAFLKRAGIKQNGNTKNPYQPIVKAFLKRGDNLMKARATKYANCIALATISEAPPAEFSKHVEDLGGIEKASTTYSKASRRTVSERNLQARSQQELIKQYLGEKPRLDCESRAAGGYSGRQLAVLECNGDETFGLYRIIELDQDQVTRFLLRHAQKEGQR